MVRFVYNNAWALGPDIKHLTEQVEKLLVGRNVPSPSSHFLLLIKFLMALLCRTSQKDATTNIHAFLAWSFVL